MRRDVCYFIPADVPSVYNAYLAAASNNKFRRECNQEPYHTISFGLNFSMKFNMNGGSCHIHFIPYQGGTAIDLRFSIAQLAGARYEKYASELTYDAMQVLGVNAQLFELDIEEFVKDSNKITPQNISASAPVQVPVQKNFSSGCGSKANAGDVFCGNCGKKL